MCGIAGIVGTGSSAQREVLETMSATIAHRGPDGSGVWVSADAALAHRRLSIVDLSSAGRQPMSYAEERFHVTFNGEIYNHVELRSQLEALGHSFHTRTDTEVLLAAYAQWGEACVNRFNGMWAFAIWDARERTLFASRDRFGKKPFYYALHQQRLYFASEVKALLGIPGLTFTVNDDALLDFCAERISDHRESTFLREVRQLPAATLLTWREGKLRFRRYWSLPDATRTTVDPDEVHSLLESAVDLRLRADTPVGCLVSGGLDSSAIACLIRERRGTATPTHVFTTLTGQPNEEAAGVDHVLQRGGFESHFHTPTARSFWADLPALLWHQEEPFADGSMAAHFALMREARSAGVPVLLTGQGADEVFAGYTTYLWIFLAELVRRGDRSALPRLALAARQQRLPLYSVLAHVLFHLTPRRMRAEVRRGRTKRMLRWLAPELRDRFQPRELASPDQRDDLNGALRQSVSAWTLPGFLHYEDRNSMAFGVETRLPFLDFRLAELLFSLASDAKLSGMVTKHLLREAVRPVVPAPIVNRLAKQGYPAPLGRWLRELEAEVLDVAHSSAAVDAGFLDVAAWRQTVRAFLSGRDEALDATWRGLICVLWHDRVLRRSERSPSPPVHAPESEQVRKAVGASR